MKKTRMTVITLIVISAFVYYHAQSRSIAEYASLPSKLTFEKRNVAVPKTPEVKIIPCIDLVMEILKTSPRYIQLTQEISKEILKNGEISFGISLEASPNPAKDKACCYSKTYDFAVYEMYSTRYVSAARFSFNPVNKQLYEYDAVQEKQKEIEYNREILVNYDASCK
jgi:hypothetical protein